MPMTTSHSLVSFTPPGREQRARRHRLSALLVISAVAGSAFALQAFHDGQRLRAPAPAAFAYFPN